MAMAFVSQILSVKFCTQVRLWDAERSSSVGIGKDHLRVVGSFAFSKKTKNFLLAGQVWFFFSFMIYFSCVFLFLDVTLALARAIY
jgi:hypothetical protein